jgi:hypothetical protein
VQLFVSVRYYHFEGFIFLILVSIFFYPFVCSFVFVEGLYSVLVSVTLCARFLCRGSSVGSVDASCAEVVRQAPWTLPVRS